MKIIGKQRRQGNYEGRDYDFTLATCIIEHTADNTEGYKAENVKIRASVLPYDKINVGADVECLYDRFGNVASVTYINTEKGE